MKNEHSPLCGACEQGKSDEDVLRQIRGSLHQDTQARLQLQQLMEVVVVLQEVEVGQATAHRIP